VHCKLMTAGLLSSCLLGCATPLPPPPATLLPPNLTEPCPPMPKPELRSNADLARAFVAAMTWGHDCRARHQALTDTLRSR